MVGGDGVGGGEGEGLEARQAAALSRIDSRRLTNVVRAAIGACKAWGKEAKVAM